MDGAHFKVHGFNGILQGRLYLLVGILLINLNTRRHMRLVKLALYAGLSLALIDAVLRAVGTKDDKWNVGIISLEHGRVIIGQCTSRGTTNRYRSSSHLTAP